MEMYNYNKIIKKLKLEELKGNEKIQKLKECANEYYDKLIRFYNYYLELIEELDENDKFSLDIKDIKETTVNNNKEYLDLIEKIINKANEIASETIELNSKIHKRDKKKKKKSHLSKFLFFTSLFSDKKKRM
ncbi:MAG: hypothetical protein ACI32H_00700 [Bacilli bacterium]